MKHLVAGLFSVLFCGAVLAQTPLPQVDLGYEIHQAISFNQTGQVYNFSNIRYGQAPVGPLRFAAPLAPTGRNTTVQNGSFGCQCPQANPAWGLVAGQFLQAYLAGNVTTFNYTTAAANAAAVLAAGANQTYTPGAYEREDCLFLDVFVPKAIFDSRRSSRIKRQTANSTGGAPVMVYIYGGAYINGDKVIVNNGNPSGLIRASQTNGGNGVIYVAINYRVGTFGFLSGSSLQAAGGVSNAGFYDQRLALDWVQKYIYLFGGDPTKVTVMGESAGGGSIQFQITAYGGQQPVPFQRAIIQSPGYIPVISPYIQENVTQNFLRVLNVSSIAAARNLSSRALMAANAAFIGASPYGQFQVGPVVDGIFSTQPNSLAWLNGGFNKNVSVMASYATNEAPAFTAPYVQSDNDLYVYMRRVFPAIQNDTFNYISQTLYPLSNYPAPIYRTFAIINELFFTCNTNYMARAYNNQTYNYWFQVPPALHGFDGTYYFYNGGGSDLSNALFAPTALSMQQYLMNFALNGNPNGPGLVPFPMQGNNASALAVNISISATGVASNITNVRDSTANTRCAWWQKALYL